MDVFEEPDGIRAMELVGADLPSLDFTYYEVCRAMAIVKTIEWIHGKWEQVQTNRIGQWWSIRVGAKGAELSEPLPAEPSLERMLVATVLETERRTS